MAEELLNLPVNIPWKQIAVSPDMMDVDFCNKKFPFAWRSSMAISAYEPKPDELPEELCGDRITYLKVTTSITGYQPTIEETRRLNDIEAQLADAFPNTPIEDIRDAISRITDDYYACYGTLLNVAVFPFPMTNREFIERNRIKIAELDDAEPGTLLDNPFVHPSGFTFEVPGVQNNRIVDIFPPGGDDNGELDLQEKMEITIAQPAGIKAVEAKVTHNTAPGVTMEAFSGTESVGTQSTGPDQGEVHKLYIEGNDIDKVILIAPENKASLLEFAYFTGPAKEVPVDVKDYPHIIDFEPKVRDLYQAATETGEILTGSKSGIKVDKSFTHTDSTESSLKLGAEITSPIPKTPLKGKLSASTSKTNTETDEEKWSVQADASRERRETQGITSQISQMYNMLTGYHVGTNRDVHLMLARPHVLQPTDRRTFVQGLRAIEGVQEFFLIVARPGDIEGLCIEAFLETGHFPEDTPVLIPEQKYKEYTEEFEVGPFKVSSSFNPFSRRSESFKVSRTFFSTTSNWEFNFEKGDGGIEEVKLPDDDVDNRTIHSYEINEPNKVIVYGTVVSGKSSSRTFHRKYIVHVRRPEGSPDEPRADIGRLLITSRGLCACFKSGEDCPEVFPPPVPSPPFLTSIVDEPVIRINSALLTREATAESRLPAMKQMLTKIQTAMSSSWRVTRRRPYGTTGFLESDYFKDQVRNLIPREHLESPLARITNLPEAVVRALGDQCTVDEALNLDLVDFAGKTGLSIEEAAKARYRLLGLKPETTRNKDSG